MHWSIKSYCPHCLAAVNASQQGCQGWGSSLRHQKHLASGPAPTEALWPSLGPWVAPGAPQESSAWQPGWQRAPSTGAGYAWAPSPTEADSSGAQKHPPCHLGPPQNSVQPILSGTGFWHLPGSSQGLPVFPCFKVGETSFFDTEFYSGPTRGGVFSQKTLLQPPLVSQFSLSRRHHFSQPELYNGFLLPSFRQMLSQACRPLNPFSGLLIPTRLHSSGELPNCSSKHHKTLAEPIRFPRVRLQLHDLKHACISMKFRPVTPRKGGEKQQLPPKGE